MISPAEDQAFLTRMLGTIQNLNTSRAIDQLLSRDDVKAKMARVSPMTRQRITGEAVECCRRLNPDYGMRLVKRDKRRDWTSSPSRDDWDDIPF